jgi:hypothetical protein
MFFYFVLFKRYEYLAEALPTEKQKLAAENQKSIYLLVSFLEFLAELFLLIKYFFI